MRLFLAGLLAFAAFTASAEDTPRQALDKKLKEYPGASDGAVSDLTDPAVTQAFPKITTFILRFAAFPVARAVPAPLKGGNLFFVRPDRSVLLVNDQDDLRAFFKDNLAKVENADAAKTDFKAWLRLGQELFQDGMFRFKESTDVAADATKDIPPSTIRVTGTCPVDPKGGDKGSVKGMLFFESGKLTKAELTSDLKSGMRPICQATKLLDPDPIVRRMAESCIVIMGQACRSYLDEQRAKATPELQREIDRVWQRILDEGR